MQVLSQESQGTTSRGAVPVSIVDEFSCAQGDHLIRSGKWIWNPDQTFGARFHACEVCSRLARTEIQERA